MARLFGSTKAYTQARKTVAHLLDAEIMVDKAFIDALQSIIDLSVDPKCSDSLRFSASKLIIEFHGKFAKTHGKNPLPKDFIEPTISEQNGDKEEEKIIQMKYIS